MNSTAIVLVRELKDSTTNKLIFKQDQGSQEGGTLEETCNKMNRMNMRQGSK